VGIKRTVKMTRGVLTMDREGIVDRAWIGVRVSFGMDDTLLQRMQESEFWVHALYSRIVKVIQSIELLNQRDGD
jgi:hypothetical protein